MVLNHPKAGGGVRLSCAVQERRGQAERFYAHNQDDAFCRIRAEGVQARDHLLGAVKLDSCSGDCRIMRFRQAGRHKAAVCVTIRLAMASLPRCNLL